MCVCVCVCVRRTSHRFHGLRSSHITHPGLLSDSAAAAAAARRRSRRRSRHTQQPLINLPTRIRNLLPLCPVTFSPPLPPLLSLSLLTAIHLASPRNFFNLRSTCVCAPPGDKSTNISSSWSPLYYCTYPAPPSKERNKL